MLLYYFHVVLDKANHCFVGWLSGPNIFRWHHVFPWWRMLVAPYAILRFFAMGSPAVVSVAPCAILRFVCYGVARRGPNIPVCICNWTIALVKVETTRPFWLVCWFHCLYLILSAQSLEWNDEPTEAQGEAESPPAVADDLCSQAFLKKEDNPAAGTEENEWDRLLRVR